MDHAYVFQESANFLPLQPGLDGSSSNKLLAKSHCLARNRRSEDEAFSASTPPRPVGCGKLRASIPFIKFHASPTVSHWWRPSHEARTYIHPAFLIRVLEALIGSRWDPVFHPGPPPGSNIGCAETVTVGFDARLPIHLGLHHRPNG